MTVYQPPDLTVDADAIFADVTADLEASIPGLSVAPGTLLWVLARQWTARYAEALQLLSERSEGEYEAFGTTVLRFPFQAATSATVQVTVTAVDTAGYTLPAGTQVTLAGLAGDRVAFSVATDVTIPNGSSTTGAGEVTLVAVAAGAGGSGLSSDPQLERPLAWVNTITVVGVSTGGADGETDDEYVDRLSDDLTLLSDTLVTPDDFATKARQQTGVARALAIDLYDADTSTANVGGHVTVAVVAADGTTVSGGNKTTLDATLTSLAITNMAVHVIDPTYTTITVVFAAVKQAPYDAADVLARAEQAVLDFLSPANWGRPDFGDALAPTWEFKDKVRFQDVSTVLNNVEGLDHWTTLTVNGGTVDVTLSGVAPLPGTVSTATGTVT